MKINKSDLLSSASKLGISQKTAEELWNSLETSEPDQPKFELSHVLYYIGAMIVLLALGWFAELAWRNFEGKGLMAVALAYMVAFYAIGSALWHKKSLKVPGGLFITLAVCMIPLAVYGFEKWTGITDVGKPNTEWFFWLKEGNLLMEIATIIGGLIALKFYRFPFLSVPVLFALWFFVYDMATLISSPTIPYESIHTGALIGLGCLILIAAFIMDLKVSEDFAFWSYLFGAVIIFWEIVQLVDHTFILLLISIIFLVLSVLIQRVIFLVIGAIGIVFSLADIYGKYFANDNLFPFILSLTGILIIFAGIAYQRNRQKIDTFILELLPKKMQDWLPKPEKHKKIY